MDPDDTDDAGNPDLGVDPEADKYKGYRIDDLSQSLEDLMGKGAISV